MIIIITAVFRSANKLTPKLLVVLGSGRAPPPVEELFYVLVVPHTSTIVSFDGEEDASYLGAASTH